jgi:prolyl 4-hydroxylase
MVPRPFLFGANAVRHRPVSASSSPTDNANSLLASGETAAAVRLLSDAAGRDDPEALYTLALWHVYGQPVPRDFGAARGLFARAGNAGHAQGKLTHAVFVAIGAGGPADWPAAVALLEAAAQNDPVAAKQVEVLAAMKLDAHGGPQSLPAIRALSASPRIGIAPALFTPSECAHVSALAGPRMTPSVVVDPASGRQIPHPIRTSDGTVLGPVQQDLVIHALNMRVAAITGTREAQSEPLAVMRYTPGQQYRLHHDCLPGEANQRIITLITYLNDGYRGGATQFPTLEIEFQASLGDALMFANVGRDGRVDERSRHAGLPITRGEKWICTRWIRGRDFDPWGMRPA